MPKIAKNQGYTGLRQKRKPTQEPTFADMVERTMKLKTISSADSGYSADLMWGWTANNAHRAQVASVVVKSHLEAGLFGVNPSAKQIKQLEKDQQKHFTEQSYVLNELKSK